MHPGSFRRRVLLAVSGLSPQIVTETLYALAVTSSEAERFVPTEIEIITTAEGAARIARDLLDPSEGAFHRLCSDYGLSGIAFTASHIHTVAGANGLPLSDIRTADENALLADAIAARVRALTADKDCALHVSLAGGRKTMSFYAGYALSLFGRDQDRLSHVLVNEPFESVRGFWYPPPEPLRLELRSPANANPPPDAGVAGFVSTASAEVGLAFIPFVRLRKGLPRGLLEGGQDFAQTVAAADTALGRPHLTVDLPHRQIVADGQRISLQPAPFGFYVALVSRSLRKLEPLHAPFKDQHDEEWAQIVRQDLRQIYGEMEIPDTLDRLLHEQSSGYLVSPLVSRLRRQLQGAIAPGRVGFYFDDGGTHRNKRYRVPLAPSDIRVIGLGEQAQPARKRRGKLPIHDKPRQ